VSHDDSTHGASGRRPGSFGTRLIHAGEERIGGAVAPPVFQSTVFAVDEAGGYEDLKYVRYSNLPNHRMLAAKLADLEGAEAALVTGSGMAAISAALLTVLGAGDHLLAGDCLYGGTQVLITRKLPALGIEHNLIDPGDPASWPAALKPSTRAIYVETITNPLMRVGDLEAVGRFAAEHGLVALIDNTFATPAGFRPVEHGFHLSLHSATKYLNGHSDLVAGAVIGGRERVAAVDGTLRLLGGSLDPHACVLLHRGLKTLELRFERQCATALALARFLAGHPAVVRVAYPGLEDHPDHQRAARLLDCFGGMLAFEPAASSKRTSVEAADRLLRRLRVAVHAPSLGGVETLVVSPARSSHRSLTPEQRAAAGISDELVRVSAGIEGADDLIADFDQALAG
jgi:cystathionine beta-lyase/cystathionine gamma-synthase